MASGNFKSLTRKHGVKICVSFPCSVESIGLAVGEKVGHSGVVSAARMNSAVVVFLDRVEKANSVVETGITVNGCFVQVLPLSQPATKVVLSNVPPFITDEFLSRELSRHGKVASPIRKLLSGCKSPLLKHVVSHRRQLYMILNNRNEELNLRFHVKVDDYDYVIFATTSVMKCFGCGEEGHTVRSCPRRSDPAPPGPGEAASAGAGAPAAPPVPERRGPAARRAAPAAPADPPGEPVAAEPAAVSERPIAAPRTSPPTSPRRGAAVTEAAQGVSTVNTPGVGGDVAVVGEGVLGEVEEREVGGEGEEEGGAGGGQVEEKTGEGGQKAGEGGQKAGEGGQKAGEGGQKAGEGGQKAGEGKSVEQDGGDSGKIGGEAGGVRVLWSVQVEEEEEMEEEAEIVKAKQTVKRRRSTRTMLNESKTSKVQVDSEVSEGECVSDSSDVPLFNSSQRKKMFTVEKFKSFLQQTKNQHGLRIEEHFPDLNLFISSARLHMSQREESGLTDQEVFRIKKLVLRAKRQLSSDGKDSNVCVN